MNKYIFKRMLILLPTSLAIVFIVFGIMSLTPSSPGQVMLGTDATPETIAMINHELGYDKPFLIRYADYAFKLLQGDMGNSYRTGRPVIDEILARFPTTAKLTAISMVLALIIGVPLGVLSSVKQYSFFDFMGTATAMLMASVPHFWFGLMAIWLFSLKLGWLPSNGSDSWVHFILPAITLAVTSTAVLLRLTRTTMLETIRQDYVRTARAKGQTEGKVIYRHALKNALLPVVTYIGMQFGILLGGTVTVEAVFSINGVGTLIINSIRMKDVPLVTGSALMLSFFFMLVMLVVDILYAYIDPRIRSRYQKA